LLRLLLTFSAIIIGALASFYGPFYVLLFYLWNAYFRPEAWVWSDIILSLRLSLTIGVALALTSIPTLPSLRMTWQVWLLVAFLAQSLLSLLTSDFLTQCLPYWIEFLKVILVCLTITILIRDRQRFRIALWLMTWSLSFETAKQGWAQLVLNPGALNPNPHVMLGDNNGVALGMMMLVPLLMALAQTSSTRLERAIHYFVLVGVAYRGLSTYSRGGFLAGGAVFLLTLWRSQHKLRTIISTAVLLSALLTVMPDKFWARMQTITAEGEDRDASQQSRLYFWSLATKMANDHPLTGVGPNGFRFEYPKYDTVTGESMRATHSSWFGILADLGYPGLTLFAAIALGALYTCQRIRARAKRAGQRDVFLFASHLQTSVFAYCVGGAFLSAHYLELWWHVVALTIALSLVPVGNVEAEPTPVLEDPVPYMPVIPAKLRVPQAGQRGRRSAGTSPSGGKAPSFFESRGESTGQAMPIAGSFHAIPNSVSG
jgi:putative inorganic carbon (HCO3(-)) transporter